MPTFRRRPVTVEAEQWFPGTSVPGVITDPKALVNMPGMHIGHQRELDGTKGLVVTRDGPRFVHGGDWVVTDQDGDMRVCHPGAFSEAYESTEGGQALTLKASDIIIAWMLTGPSYENGLRSSALCNLVATALIESRRKERERCRGVLITMATTYRRGDVAIDVLTSAAAKLNAKDFP